MTENEIRTLLKDEQSNEVLVKAFLTMHHFVFCKANSPEEHYWGPANETLSRLRKLLEPHLERIAESKRKK